MKTAFSIIPLTIEARGEIIANNLPEFRELVREALGNINRDLTTDEEFGQAEIDVKALKEAEEAVRAAAIKAFDDQLKALVDGLNETAEEIRAPRLELEKLIAKRKDEVKAEIVEEALATFDIDPKDARKAYLTGLQAAIKGKRTLDSMRQACRIYATSQQAKIGQARQLITRFEDTHGGEMTMDRRDLELWEPDRLEIELRRRFEARKAMREKQRLEEEAAAARAAESKAKDESARLMRGMLPPSDLPTPPKIGAIPTGPSPAAEWEAWLSACKTTFGALKAAREALKHEANIERANAFRNAINHAWCDMTRTGEDES